MLFRRTKHRGVRRSVEPLERRQYWYTPDMYIPILGGGCMCGACTPCLGGPQTNDSVDLSSSPGNAAPLVDPMSASLGAANEAAPAVTGLVLYNANTGQPIGPFENNTTIDYASLPPNLSVRATTAGPTGSVRFGVDADTALHTENFAPYSIQGEKPSGLPNPWTPANGTHQMSVTGYSGSNASGAAGAAFQVTFHVANAPTGGTPTPPVVSGPVVRFSDSSADAREAGLDKGTLVISRTGSTSSSLAVGYNVSGTATNSVDYQALSGTITIPAGKSSVNLLITPKQDSLVEGTETVVVSINQGNGYSLGSVLTASCPILDNDSVGTPPPGPGAQQGISDITWSRNAPRSPLHRTEAGTVQIGSKLYVLGGFGGEGGSGTFFPLTRRVHVYDMATRQWRELASLPSAAAGNHFGVATEGSNIYVIAGQTTDTYGVGTNTSWKYNIAANQWTKFTNLPEVRYGGAAFIENGLLHFVGGNKADRATPTTDHWAINLADPAADWARRASMPLPGDHLSHAKINGKVYLFGGEHGHAGIGGVNASYVQHNYTFEYNPANDTWTRKADMPLALSHIEGSTLVINGKAVLIGGLLTGGGANTTSRVHVYDPVANTWKLLSTRFPKRIIGASAGSLDGKIYMTDGYSPDDRDGSAGFEGTVKFA